MPKDIIVDKAIIILVLGRLYNNNSLLSFIETTKSLESGELLGTSLDKP
jgi:hypothetical protein